MLNGLSWCAAEIAKPGDKQPELPPNAGEGSIHRMDKLRFAKGSQHTSKIRNVLQRTMQNEAAVFRTAVRLCSLCWSCLYDWLVPCLQGYP